MLVEGGWRLSVSSSMQFFVLPLIQKNTRLMLNLVVEYVSGMKSSTRIQELFCD
ncbi:hypothetical protein O59_001226 [Cellvibrio sp. BR]|nr:hypothetical protein O59_001226 [Cellvibrio sp. BR]